MLKMIVLGRLLLQSEHELCCKDRDEGNVNTIVFVPGSRGCRRDTVNVYVDRAEFMELVRE